VAQADVDIFVRLERFYDAVPRPYVRVEDFGALVLFVREGEGWPYYARPVIGAETPSAADITAVRRRQRELGVPEALEWVHETTPDLLPVARSAGLDVHLAPLLVLDPAALLPELPVPGATIRMLDPRSPTFADDVAASRAVSRLGFGAPASATLLEEATASSLVTIGAGPAERDAALTTISPAELERLRALAAGIDFLTAVADSPTEGILATGGIQRAEDISEVVGVATLPSARNRGYASRLTATLAHRTLDAGATTVFLSASDDDVARLYSRVGFRRIGTACIAQPAAV
jgi:ribosomal protein S18 acetylase RimI-like enzyme